MKRDYTLFVKDILVAISKIEEFIGDTRFEEFVRDDKTASAVVRKLEIIGEASKNIPRSIKQKYKALEGSGADSMEVMADLNRVTWKIIVDSLKAERAAKNLSEEELVQICRKIAPLGRRDTPRP